MAPMPPPHQPQERWDPGTGLSPIPPGAGASAFLLLQAQFLEFDFREGTLESPLAEMNIKLLQTQGFIDSLFPERDVVWEHFKNCCSLGLRDV